MCHWRHCARSKRISIRFNPFAEGTSLTHSLTESVHYQTLTNLGHHVHLVVRALGLWVVLVVSLTCMVLTLFTCSRQLAFVLCMSELEAGVVLGLWDEPDACSGGDDPCM